MLNGPWSEFLSKPLRETQSSKTSPNLDAETAHPDYQQLPSSKIRWPLQLRKASSGRSGQILLVLVDHPAQTAHSELNHQVMHRKSTVEMGVGSDLETPRLEYLTNTQTLHSKTASV